jgi:hypothetical protein
VQLEPAGRRRDARDAFDDADLRRRRPRVSALEGLESDDDVGVVEDERLEARVERGGLQRAELGALAAVGDDRRLGVGGQVDLLDGLELLERGLESGRLDFDVLPVVLQDDVGRGLSFGAVVLESGRKARALRSSPGGVAATSALRRRGDGTPRQGDRHRETDENFHPAPPYIPERVCLLVIQDCDSDSCKIPDDFKSYRPVPLSRT